MDRPQILPASTEERLIVALDVPAADAAVGLIESLGPRVRWVKVGLELFCAEGPSGVERIAATGKRIFLDLKFHDIPTTIAGAVEAAARLPVHLMNLHAAAGREGMAAAARAASFRADLGLLAVTRLTSALRAGADDSDVARAAEAAAEAGLFGIVCPAPAAALVRRTLGDRLALVCPGIRPAGAEADDQVQIATPAGAVRAGADWIVVGRPITRAADPAEAVRAVLEEISDAEEDRPGI